MKEQRSPSQKPQEAGKTERPNIGETIKEKTSQSTAAHEEEESCRQYNKKEASKKKKMSSLTRGASKKDHRGA